MLIDDDDDGYSQDDNNEVCTVCNAHSQRIFAISMHSGTKTSQTVQFLNEGPTYLCKICIYTKQGPHIFVHLLCV